MASRTMRTRPKAASDGASDAAAPRPKEPADDSKNTVLLQNQIYSQNPYVKVYAKCKYYGVGWKLGQYVVELAGEELTDRGKPASGAKAFAGRVISGFMEEGNEQYVVMQEVVPKEEIKRKKFANALDLDSPFYLGSTLSIASLDALSKTLKKSSYPGISQAKWADTDKKVMHDGEWPFSLEKLKAGDLASKNVSIYHPRFRRCVAHVIGCLEIDAKDSSSEESTNTENPSEGPQEALLVRFYYKHDESDIVRADTDGAVSQIVNKHSFKKQPRLWSNHIGIFRSKILSVAEEYYFCHPEDVVEVPQTTVFNMFDILERKIVPLPGYLVKWTPPPTSGPASVSAPSKKRKATGSVEESEAKRRKGSDEADEEEVFNRLSFLAQLIKEADPMDGVV